MRTHSAVAAGTQLTGPPAPWCPAGSLMEQYTLQPDGSMTVRAITTVGSNSAEVVQVGSHPSPCTHVALPCPSPLWDPTAQRWCRWAATPPPAHMLPCPAHHHCGIQQRRGGAGGQPPILLHALPPPPHTFCLPTLCARPPTPPARLPPYTQHVGRHSSVLRSWCVTLGMAACVRLHRVAALTLSLGCFCRPTRAAT
jgi:hypothetical protein